MNHDKKNHNHEREHDEHNNDHRNGHEHKNGDGEKKKYFDNDKSKKCMNCKECTYNGQKCDCNCGCDSCHCNLSHASEACCE